MPKTPKAPPAWDSLSKKAETQRRKLMPKAAKPAKKVEPPKPKGFAFEAYWAENQQRYMKNIQYAMGKGETKMGGLSMTPIGIDTDTLVAKLNEVLPAPFRAINVSTYGWDATEMYDITWAPERT